MSREQRKQQLKLKRDAMFAALIAYKYRKGCAKCGRHPDGANNPGMEFDHIIPRYLGGRPHKPVTSSPMRWWRVWLYMIHPNIQVLCHGCHKAKTQRGDI